MSGGETEYDVITVSISIAQYKACHEEYLLGRSDFFFGLDMCRNGLSGEVFRVAYTLIGLEITGRTVQLFLAKTHQADLIDPSAYNPRSYDSSRYTGK